MNLIVLATPVAAKDYREVLRRITALVKVDEVEQELVFLTNNLQWSPASVADPFGFAQGRLFIAAAGPSKPSSNKSS